MTPDWSNRMLWTGDNLDVMRGMNSGAVDLIYLDPPFNSNRDRAAPIGSEAAGAAFRDTWTPSDVAVFGRRNFAAELLGREWVGIDVSPLAAKLVKSRLRKAMGPSGDVRHRKDVPRRADPGELPDHRTRKRVLYGVQEGLCAGCRVLFPFRDMTVDHVVPRSGGGSGRMENLRLLCAACHSMKGARPQEECAARPKEKGLRR